MRSQYAKSTDPEVIAAVEHNTRQRDEFHAAVKELLTERDIQRFRASTWNNTYRLAAVVGKPDEQRFGRYTKNGQPYRSNTAEWDAWKATTRQGRPVPGCGDFHATGADGAGWFMQPTPFLHDGAAWVLMGNMPTEGEFGPQWVEVRASEAHAAREAWVGAATNRGDER